MFLLPFLPHLLAHAACLPLPFKTVRNKPTREPIKGSWGGRPALPGPSLRVFMDQRRSASPLSLWRFPARAI